MSPEAKATEEAAEQTDEVDEVDVTESPRASRFDELVGHPRVRQATWAITAVLAFWLVIQWLWPTSLGQLVEGAVLGGLTALIALSLALIYRANRVVNFAAADLGSVPAVFGVMLITAVGFHYFLAIPIALISSLILGALVEFLVIRPFFRAARLILTVVTIGLAQVLGAIGAILPQAFDQDIPAQDYPSPFDWSFTIGNQILTGNHIIAMIAIPAVIAGLILFFRYTDVGIAVRASASSAERASLLGVPVKRMQTTVWMLAALLATLSMLLRAGIIGLPIGRLLGPSILLPALAAAVIGRFERFSWVVIAALGIGMVDVAVFSSTGESQFVAPVLFLIILGALLVQRRSASRLEASQTSTWRAVQEHRPIPRELARLPEVRFTRWGLAAALGGFVLTTPLFMSNGDTIRLAAMMTFAIVGISLVVLTGWAGEVSLGHVAFLGLGAAVAGGITQRGLWVFESVDLSIALLLGGLFGAVVAVLIGLPALRVRGMFLAVTTLAFALATSDYFLGQRYFGDVLPTGLVERPALLGRISVTTEPRFYYLTLACLVLVIFAVRGIRRSRTGRALISLRENERAAEAFGINATRVKLTAFAFSGFFAAFAGGLFVHLQRSLGVNPFLPEESLKAFTMVVIGGLGSVPGAIIGATYIRGLEWFLPGWLPSELAFVAPLLGSGLGLILVLLLFKGGLSGALYQVRDDLLRRVAARRGILVPSLVADAREAGTADDEVVIDAAEAAPPEPTTEDGNGGSRRSKAKAKAGAS